MTILDDYTRVRWVRFMAKKDQTGDVLRTFIADVAQPAKLENGAVTRMKAESSKFISKPC